MCACHDQANLICIGDFLINFSRFHINISKYGKTTFIAPFSDNVNCNLVFIIKTCVTTLYILLFVIYTMGAGKSAHTLWTFALIFSREFESVQDVELIDLFRVLLKLELQFKFVLFCLLRNMFCVLIFVTSKLSFALSARYTKLRQHHKIMLTVQYWQVPK